MSRGGADYADEYARGITKINIAIVWSGRFKSFMGLELLCIAFF